MNHAPIRQRIHAIVLAAGEGRRMGGPKSMLCSEGTTLLEQHVRRLAGIPCATISVVVRPEVSMTARSLLRTTYAGVLDARPPSQAASLALALRFLPLVEDEEGESIVIVTPVDMLPAKVATYRLLVETVAAGALAATPTYLGAGGHPIVTRRSVLAAYDSGPTEVSEPPPLRDVLRGCAGRMRIEVPDPKVLEDFDTPSDLPARVHRFHALFA